MRRLLLPVVTVIGVAITVLGMAMPAAGATRLGGDARAAQAVAQATPTGTFSIENYNSHECLGIAGGEDDAAAIQWDCNRAPDQTWHIGQNSGGTSVYHQIINGDGECLGVYAISTTEGADVVAWQCLGPTHPDQYWAWVESHTDPGYYYLLNLNSNLVVGVLGNSTAEGTAIVQWINQDTPNNQLWEPTFTHPAPSGPSGEACVFDAPSGVTPSGLIGHVGWGFRLPNGSWEFGANEGPGNLYISKTWAKTGSQHAMLATFTNGGPYHSTGYYTSLECVTVPAFNASAAQQEVRHERHQIYIPIFQDCESQAYNVLSKYGVNALPNDILHPVPNSWYNDLTTIARFGPPTSL